ncbi:hypothetical protein [Terracoccus luteus]|nr:hypothetical protein [Terracoccus luteus]MBB2985398.1 hypothetical protein [Terracoccus luteus]MCP2171050.1 hypothetical protein [Terracoccus luteus]
MGSPRRHDRALRATVVAAASGGVAHRRDLRAAGLTRHDVATEVAAGRWLAVGRHTVATTTGDPSREALWWRAVWESGAGAVLDGVSALQAQGMTGFETAVIDVSMPSANRDHDVAGVRLHRRRVVGPVAGGGIPRAHPVQATIRAAQWATSDRQAALLLCLPVQQRLVRPDDLFAAWAAVGRSPRRALLHAVVRDVCDGAQSLGELDVGRLCRRRGIPPPSRQRLVRLPTGRVYLDVAWEDIGLVVEIDGGHHLLALNTVDDALRQNEVTMGSEWVLRIPVLGLRLAPDRFLDQLLRAWRLRAAEAGDGTAV